MTVVTGITAGEVGRVFAGRNDTVVTRITGANDLRVIDSKHRREDIRVVAILANIARLDMCQILAGRLHAIVAVDAIPGDVQVVEICRQPPGSGMAVVTSIPAGQMVEVFSTRDNTIVTRATGSDDLHVVDNVDRRERTGVVAVFTNNCGLYMCRVFARRGHAIMAGPAGAQNLRVIDGECRVPDIRCVAVLADVAGLNMGERLTGRFSTVVTTDTVARDVYVIEIRR
jgi:hypothetical protein